MSSFTSAIEALPDCELATLSKSGTPPERRVTTAGAAYKILQEMRRQDKARAANRAMIQAMFDGEPPYRAADLVNTGQGARSNLNFDEAGALLENAMSGYVDLFASTENFMDVRLKHGSYPLPLKKDYEQKLSASFTQMLRRWRCFFTRFLRNCHHFLSEGISVCYFLDTFDWRWEVAKFGEFYLPDNTKADMDALETAGGIQGYRLAKLYSKIRNEKSATAMGWKVEAVKKMMVEAAHETNYPGKTGEKADWETLQVSIKNNDAFWSTCSAEVQVGHLWVKEFSGRWSHFMIPFLAADATDFLYEKVNKFEEERVPFFIFSYGLGSNAYYHGIRGLGHKIYPHIQVSNRLHNQVVDSAMLSSSLLIQPKDEEAMKSLALIYYGPYAVLPPKHAMVDQRVMPNLGQNAMPVISSMSNMLQAKTGQYNSLGVFADSKERTRFEMEAYVARLAKLSITALNLFYEPWEMMLREVLRRVANRHYSALIPGGAFVVDTKKRTHALGVPSEVWEQIDFESCVVFRAVGGGSPEARIAKLNNLAQMAPAMDEVGQHNLLRDRVAAELGSYELASRYVAEAPQNRTTMDDKVAWLENNQMEQGTQVPVFPHEFHLVHLKIHIAKLTEWNDAVNQGTAELREILEPMTLLHVHCVQHVEQGGKDPSATEAYAYFRQALQHIGGTIWNGHKEMEREMRKQAQEGGTVDQGLSPQMVKMLNEHNVKLSIMKEKHDMQMQMDQARFAAKMAETDALAAVRVRPQGFASSIP
jgi:hypothetical protein